MFICLFFFFQSDSPVKRYLVLGKYNMFQLLFIENVLIVIGHTKNTVKEII